MWCARVCVDVLGVVCVCVVCVHLCADVLGVWCVVCAGVLTCERCDVWCVCLCVV